MSLQYFSKCTERISYLDVAIPNMLLMSGLLVLGSYVAYRKVSKARLGRHRSSEAAASGDSTRADLSQAALRITNNDSNRDLVDNKKPSP
jgi:hypothetical protein